VNGLRSVYRKGFVEWLEKESPDIVCLQEIKTRKDQMSFDFFEPSGYQMVFSSAEKKGYSGVAVYFKKVPRKVVKDIGLKRFDSEGRILKLVYEKFILLNVYIPHGSRDKRNLKYKLQVYRKLIKELEKSRKEKIIIAGDFNIAHKEIDLARPKQNMGNTMFSDDERAQIDSIVDLGFIDSFRKYNKDGENYTWWPYTVNARERNLGWRLDYIFVSKPFLHQLENAFILKDIEGSDHCPVGIDIAI